LQQTAAQFRSLIGFQRLPTSKAVGGKTGDRIVQAPFWTISVGLAQFPARQPSGQRPRFSLGLPSHASLGDILPFIYLEFGAMVGIYFKTTRLPVRYLMYIAMTALGRVLIEIVGAEHRTGMVILIIAGAILVVRNSGSQVWRVERKRSMNNSQR
jgi:hypothetical protein